MSSILPEGAGIIVGVGVGAAASAALEPAIEIPRQEAWARNRNRILDPSLMARLVAQGAISLGEAQDAAHRDGLSDDKFDKLVYLAQTVPGFAEVLALWRRNPQAFRDLWTHALVKSGIDARYLPYLDQLRDDRLSPPVVALAIVRGILADPGFLPVGPPATEGKVPAFPTSPLDPLAEAAAFGFDKQRLFVQTAISGRPMGPIDAAQSVFRGILERVDFDRAISEGDVRNEWASAIFEHARQILTSSQYTELRLRGWINDAAMYAGTAKHGMSPEETDLLHKMQGRPITVHQVTTGEARGGRFEGPTDQIPSPYLRSLQEGNIRPEWYSLDYANRYSYSVPFWLRSLMQSGVFTEPEAEQILLELGNRPDLAKLVAQHFTASTTGTGAAKVDPWVAKADTQLWTATHKGYKGGAVDQTAARERFDLIGIPAAAQDAILTRWDSERAL